MKTFLLSIPVLAAVAAVACSSSDSNDNGEPQGGASSRGGSGGSGDTGGDAGEGNGSPDDAGSAGTGTERGEGGEAGSGATPGDAGAANVGGKGGAGGSASEPPPSSLTFNIKVSAARRAISPLIYGVNPQGVACDNATAKFALCRLGGHAYTAYNWENNASNAGVDNCFQNDGALSASDTPGAAVTGHIAAAQSVGGATLIQIPTLDYVAADKAPGSASPDCSGDVRKSGGNYLTTRFKTNRASKGSALSPTPDTSDSSVSEDEFVSFLSAQAQGTGAKLLFSLDNQPDTWAADHVEIHPTPATYDEVVRRNVEYATMLKNTAPTAEVTGYVGYGYYGFQTLQDATDRTGKGVFIDYYLSQMQAASQAAGKRLVDYLDVHWYSEATASGVRILGDSATAGMRRARVQAPRSFWDDSFLETSWITAQYNKAISLIPWLDKHIALAYSGTKIAISEWNFGGGADISGAIAAADSLGIFGREGVSLAAYVSTSSMIGNDPFVYGAFGAFRNYDGAGSTFGDTSVEATTNSIRYSSVYASVDSSDGDRLVMVAINRSELPLSSEFVIDHTASYTSADVYQLTDKAPTIAAAGQVKPFKPNRFTVQLPAYSVSVVAVHK